MAFEWSQPPDRQVFIWMRVEQRPTVDTPGPILASTGPVPHRPRAQTILAVNSVPNGSDRRVIVEVRDEPNADLRVSYYGISEPFVVRPDHDELVPVALELAPSAAATHPAEVRLLVDGEPRDRVGRADIDRLVIETRSVGARTAVLANNASLTANLTSRVINGPQLTCRAETDTESVPAAPTTWDVCEITGWDLTAGLAASFDSGVHALGVYVAFQDPQGYPSPVHRASVTLDLEPPAVLGASLSPPVAAAFEVVQLSVTLDEPHTAARLPRLTVSPAGDATPGFGQPSLVEGTTTWQWTAETGDAEDDDQQAYAFAIELADAHGNAVGPLPLVDDSGAELTLYVDGKAPELELDPPPTLNERLFGLGAAGDMPGERVVAFDFAIGERNPPRLPDGPCDAACPQVRIGGRAVGEVSRGADGIDRWGFHYAYPVDPAAWPAASLTHPVTLHWSDAAGNPLDEPIGEPVRFDFARPTAVECSLVPEHANGAATILYTISVSEALRSPPVLDVPADSPFFGLQPEPSLNGLSFTWSREPQGIPDGEYALRAWLMDVAGNRSAAPVCDRTVGVDSIAPSLAGPVTLVVRRGGFDGGVRDAAIAGLGDTLEVALDVREAQALSAAATGVALQARVPLALEGGCERAPGGSDRWDCVYRRTFGAEDRVAEGRWPVRIHLEDAAGNAYDALHSGPAALVTLDVTPPSSRCALDPPGGRVARDETVRLFVEVDEPQAPGYPRVEAPGIPFDAGTASGFVTTFAAAAGAQPPPPGPLSYAVRVMDVAGNAPPEPACAGEIEFDAVLPAVVPGSVTVDGALAYRDGADIGVTFAVTEDLAADPVVTIGGRPALVDAELDGPPNTWRYRYRVDRRYHAEGVAPLTVELVDRAGNRATEGIAEPHLVLDFTAPQAQCVLTPAGRPARHGEEIRLTINASEGQAPGFPRVDAVGVNFEPHQASGFGTTLRARDALSPDLDRGFSYQVDLMDRAGNLRAAACSGEGRLDTAYPVVTPGSVTVDPDRPARHLDVITVGFDAPGLATAPTLTIGGRRATPLPSEGDHYSFELAVDEGQDARGLRPVASELVDAAGNVQRADPTLGALRIRFDFDAPRLVGAAYIERCDDHEAARIASDALWLGGPLDCGYTTRPGACGAEDPPLRAPVRVAFTLDEDPGELRVSWAGRGLPLDPCATTGRDAVALYTPSGDEPEDVCVEGWVDVSDRAGNPARLPLGCLWFDRQPPEAPDVATTRRIVYHRAPWGWEPGSPGTPDFRIVGQPGSLPAPGVVIAYNPFPLAEIGRAAGDDDGGFAMTLEPADRAGIELALTDRAGNRSRRVGVRDTDWVASMGGKLAGWPQSNPHQYAVGDHEVPCLLVAGEPGFSEVDGEALQAVDGAVHASAARGAWIAADRATRPEPRRNAAMAYDAARGKAVLFGGSGGGGATWEWDGRRRGWEQVATSGPGSRTQHALAYDARRGEVVLFGGKRSPDCGEPVGPFCGYTWAWDGEVGRWSRLATTGPPGRESGLMAYDAARDRIVFFGGFNDPDCCGGWGRKLADTWEWDGDQLEWTQRANGGPTAGTNHALTYDPARRRVLLWAGDPELDDALVHVWAWNGTTGIWEKVGLEGPGAFPSPAMTYDAASDAAIFFGGAQTWRWDSGPASWRQLDAIGPSDRREHAMVYSAAERRVLLFGGYHYNPNGAGDCHEGLGEACGYTWALDTAAETWSRADDPGPPPRRGATLAADPARGVAVLFGGQVDPDCGEGAGPYCARTWSWNASARAWQSFAAAGPTPRTDGALAFDAATGQVLLFGGHNAGGCREENGEHCGYTWGWDGERARWQRLATTGPTARSRPALVSDLGRARVMLVGGFNGEVGCGEGADAWCGHTWEWDGEAVSWQRVSEVGPSPRGGAAVHPDSSRGLAVLFGGENADAGCGEDAGPLCAATWEWNGGAATWARVADGGPPARARASLAYDPARDRALLFGGRGVDCGADGEGICDDLWSFDGRARRWRRIEAAGPAGRADPVMAVADEAGQAILFGGEADAGGCGQAAGGQCTQTWVWDGGATVRPMHIFTARLAALLGEGAAIDVDEVALRWTAGGDGAGADDAPESGVELAMWDRGAWRPVASGDAPAERPSAVEWVSNDRRLLEALPYGPERLLGFAITPRAPSGSAGADVEPRFSTLAADHVELVVRYRRPWQAAGEPP